MDAKGQRLVIYGGLGGIILLAWAYLFYLATTMQMSNLGMNITMPSMQPWHLTDIALNFFMWVVMMVAMMTPSALPMILTYRAITQNQHKENSQMSSTWLFLLGYLAVWAGFGAVATLAQWGLHRAALLSPMISSTSPVMGGILLISAGIYQLTPLKDACLSRCRTPLGFLLGEWRDGKLGPLVMGMRHGLYCVGCCWMLMALLFVGGVMNLVWVALMAVYILIEKAAPARLWISRIAGVAVILWGAWLLVGLLINPG